MNISEIMDKINHIESTFPVETWKIKGIDVWPILRMRVYFRLFEYYNFEKETTVIDCENRISLYISKIKLLLNYIKGCVPFIFDRRLRRINPADVIFLADPSYVLINNQYYQRLTDPIAKDIKGYGLTFNVLTYFNNVKELKTSAIPISSYIRRRHIIFNIFYKLGLYKLSYKTTDEEQAILNCVKDSGNGILDTLVEDFLFEIEIFMQISKTFASLLELAKPRFAFVVSYYDFYNMAFVYACRSKGIVVVDLQHGAINDYNAPYGRWNSVPEQGYNTLPDFFACWDKESAKTIEDSFKGKCSTHLGVVFGNKFLEESINKEFYDDDGPDVFSLIIKSKDERIKNILLTIQTKYGLSDLFIETINRSPDNYFWWIRLHPMISALEKKTFLSQLKRINNMNYDYEVPTREILYSILPFMDVHITASSSVVKEARIFGVESIITDETGLSYYADDIKDGYAFYTKSAIEIIRKIGESKRRVAAYEKISSDALYRAIGLIK